MLLSIAQLGQPVLRQPSSEVALEDMLTPDFQQFLGDMLETLRAEKGAGLAAPQVFVSQRVFLAIIAPPETEGQLPPVEVFINPRLVGVSEDSSEAWEGCLSFPELLVCVRRFRSVRVEYRNAFAEPSSLELFDFFARVVQHEHDHLEGILTIDRPLSTHHIIKASEIETVRAASM